jgi:hypothetical protein
MLGLLARRTGLLQYIRSTAKEDVRAATDPLRAEIKRLTQRVERLVQQVERLELDARDAAREVERKEQRERQSALVKQLVKTLDTEQRARLRTLPAVLDEARVVRHVQTAVAEAHLFTDPYPHIVVDHLFPEDVYTVLLEAIPPPAFFGERDPIKQNLRIPISYGPALAVRAWQFVDEIVMRRAVQPALMTKFDEQLRQHYAAIFGPSFQARALSMPLEMSGGRLMLRRPGYHLGPHRDPKRSVGTCLLYFARDADRESYGTEIYRVFGDAEAGYTETYYPEQEGRRCELVKVVPYRPNTMLAFLNTNGAHGATIPADAPSALERYSVQYYFGPAAEALTALTSDLPAERQRLWRSKKSRSDDMS